MSLSFDLDEVEGTLDAPEMAAPWPSATAKVDYSARPDLPTLPLEPNSKAASVTVFSDRAHVTRVLTQETTEGASSLSFLGLPFGLSSASLHATVVKGDARIVGVELVSGESEALARARRKRLREEMRPLADQLGEVRDRMAALLGQRHYLRSNLLAVPSGDRPQPALDQVRGTFSWVGESERVISAGLRAEEDKARELDEELAPMLIKLANPFATGLEVKVDLDAAKAGPVEVALQYEVDSAAWTPGYGARLEPATGHVTLGYQGVIAQYSGEDWADVSLELSTANPAVAGTVPELQPW